MSNVQNTLNAALPTGAQGAYPHEYQNVLDALVKRDYELVDAIASEVSRHFGVSQDQVKDQLAYIGMAARPAPVVAPTPEPVAEAEVEAPAKKAKKSKKDKTAKLVRKLVKAAERHGISL